MPLGNIELNRSKPINGFPRFASKIASDPDKTTTIYRRFDRLSARNLLFLEAELAELEALQDRQDAADLNSADPTTISCHSDWSKFESCANKKDGDGSFMHQSQAEKLALALKIKEKLKEYRKTSCAKRSCVQTTDHMCR
jgi:hypothetical protein